MFSSLLLEKLAQGKSSLKPSSIHAAGSTNMEEVAMVRGDHYETRLRLKHKTVMEKNLNTAFKRHIKPHSEREKSANSFFLFCFF